MSRAAARAGREASVDPRAHGRNCSLSRFEARLEDPFYVLKAFHVITAVVED
jgi:hypothetical protein